MTLTFIRFKLLQLNHPIRKRVIKATLEFESSVFFLPSFLPSTLYCADAAVPCFVKYRAYYIHVHTIMRSRMRESECVCVCCCCVVVAKQYTPVHIYSLMDLFVIVSSCDGLLLLLLEKQSRGKRQRREGIIL